MRKALGLLAWTSLAAAGLWAALPGGTTRPVSADQPATNERGSTLSRMNPFTRSKPKSNDTSYRQSAEKLMKEAQASAARGDVMGARKLLERAQSFPVDWGPDDRTPEKFLAQLEASTTSRTPETAIAGRNAAKPNGNSPATNGVEELDSPVARTPKASGAARSPIQQINNEQGLDQPADERASMKPRTAGLSPAQKKATAKSLLQQARQDLLNGDIEDAREKAEQAAAIDVVYSAFEERPEQILAEINRREGVVGEETPRDRNMAQKPKAKSPVTDAAFDEDEPRKPRTGGTSATEKMANAKSLMQQARRDLANGDVAAAREKAEQAAEIDVAYSPFDERPEQLLSEIGRREGINRIGNSGEAAPNTRSTAQTQKPASKFSEIPFDEDEPQPAPKLTAAPKKPAAWLVDDVPFDDEAPEMTKRPAATAELTPSTNDKQLAQQLLKQAQAAIAKGDIEQARSLALEASELEVTYGLFDLQPRQVLAQIDRSTNNLTITKNAAKVKTAAKELVNSVPEMKSTLSKEMPVEEDELPISKFVETAKSKASIATGLTNKTIRTEVEATKTAADEIEAQAKQSAARIVAADKAAANTLNKAKTDDDEATAKVRQQAVTVLQQARKEMQAGRIDSAREKALAAQNLNTTFGLWDDRPESLLEEIDRLAETKKPAPVKNNVSNGTKAQAIALLKQARADMAAGNVDDAQDKVTQASELNVAFGVFDDRPEQVQMLIDRAKSPPTARNTAAKPKALVDEPEETATPAPQTAQRNPIKPQPVNSQAAFSDDEPEADDVAVIHPEGPSAEQLFREGQNHLQSGNKAAAHQAFVRAYQSGQKLDARRSQQLQDYLRELNPRRGKPIQMVSAEEGSADETAEPRTLDPQRPIDIASERQKVQLDRLRSEVLNAVSRAERYRDKDPAKSIEVLDQAMANVETSPLEKKLTASLTTSLRKTRSEIESFQKQMEPNLIQAKSNSEVKQSIDRERKNKVRTEREFASLVKEYNEFLEQKRYAEAEVRAKQAKELDPDNPVAETMVWKAKFARRVNNISNLKDAKEDGFVQQLDSVEWSAVPFDDREPFRFGKDWKDITARRKGKYNTDTRLRSPEEQRIENSLTRPITLQFENVPLNKVIEHISRWADVNVVIDKAGLEDVNVTPSSPVSINVDGIPLKDALYLVLHPMELGHTINHSVLNITSEQRLQGQAMLATYSVADLVVPIQPGQPNMNVFGNVASIGTSVGGQLSVPSTGGPQGGQFQVGQAGATMGSPVTNPWVNNSNNWNVNGGSSHDFRNLIDLIVSVCEPNSWEEVGGGGHIKGNETTLSLVIRQTQKVHDEIRDLLEQLRRLQDLQVTIEVRFVSVSDNFFERIGVDFDFDLQDSIGGPNLFSGGGGGGQAGQGGQGGQAGQAGGGLIPLPPFGTQLASQQAGQAGQGGQGGQGAQAGQAGGQAGGTFFTSPGQREFTDRDNYGKGPTVLGLGSSQAFTQDLDIAFRQGSFGIGVPDFGRFDANAGVNIGFAILSDIETFFFINAAQGDRRNNIMSAPKVTLFNGQTGSVFDGAQRPFVTQLIPVVGAFAVGYQPIITPVFEGVGMSVQAVISADRRYVRLAVTPSFSVIREVQAFTFVSAGGQQGQQGQRGGQGGGGQGGGGQGGGGQGGGQQGFGGIGGGVGVGYEGIYNHGMFGQAMGDRADLAVAAQSGFGGIGGGGGGGQFGGGGGGQGGQGGGGQQGQGGFQAAGAGEVTVQQPIVASTTVLTTVAVPDGGTVLLGGVKRLSESRNMAGVPILNKIPYISRLFKNTGVGRETQSLMLMVTPRIVILEEEESLLGIPN